MPEAQLTLPAGAIERPLSVLDIPEILFREVSERLGIDEEFVARTEHGLHTARVLNADHRILMGFRAAVGFRRITRVASLFVFWDDIPQPREKYSEDIFPPNEVITISAGPSSVGIWALGSGEKMRERATARLYSSLLLETPYARLAALILFRASTFASDPRCRSKSWWDASFTEP